MKRTKKMAAWALAATMMLSSSMAVFAGSDVTLPTTGTGTVQGSGTSEGHVNKEVLNVLLPTVDASKPSAFAYTMDPERLIQGTDAAKYEEGVTFPAKDTDTGVYFLTAPNTYANTSNIYQVVNKSSCDITLTVDVQAAASAGGTDIALASAIGDITTATVPTLYLGLKVGNTDQVISNTKATVTKTIAGSSSNFEIGVNTKDDGTKEYTYREKSDAKIWKAMNISMTGSVNKLDIAANTTAPAVDVTWSWEKAADNASVDTDTVDYNATPATSSVPENVTVPDSGDVTVPVTLGSDGADLTKLETTLYAGDMLTLGNGYGATYTDGTITLGADVVAFLRDSSADDLAGVTFTATFGTGNDAYTTTFKFTK